MRPTHNHAVHFYQDSESLASTVAAYLADGFVARQPAVVVATLPHTTAIMAGLDRLGADSSALRRAGELQAFDARKLMSSFMVGASPDPLMFMSNVSDVLDRLCAGRPPSRVRIYGEMVDLLWQDGNADAALHLEELWNQLASAYDFSLLCGYAFGHFFHDRHKEPRDAAAFDAVRCRHSHVV